MYSHPPTQQGALVFHTDKHASYDIDRVRLLTNSWEEKNDCSLKVIMDVEMAFSMSGSGTRDYNLPFIFN